MGSWYWYGWHSWSKIASWTEPNAWANPNRNATKLSEQKINLHQAESGIKPKIQCNWAKLVSKWKYACNWAESSTKPTIWSNWAELVQLKIHIELSQNGLPTQNLLKPVNLSATKNRHWTKLKVAGDWTENNYWTLLKKQAANPEFEIKLQLSAKWK